MRLHAAGLLCLTALLVSGCGTVGPSPADADQSAGKELFINGPKGGGAPSCGSCHVLADAGSLGKVGPSLDDSFAASRKQGFSEDTIRDVVRDQIAMASPPMPQNIVTGQDAADVAAYVAAVAGMPAAGTTTAATATESTPATTQETTTAETTTTATTTEGTTTEGGGDADQGKALFTSLGCAGCHSIDGAKGTGPTFKGLYGSMVKLTNGKTVPADDPFLLESIFDPDKTIEDGYSPGLMSAVIKPGSISQADAKALVAYIETLK